MTDNKLIFQPAWQKLTVQIIRNAPLSESLHDGHLSDSSLPNNGKVKNLI
jgi:hypothetical protein